MKKLIITVVCISLFFSACIAQDDGSIEIRTSEELSSEAAQDPENAQVKIAVYICGEVKAPGVYYFDEGSRIADALEAAGGPEEDADLQSVNLAQRLTDGQQIFVNPLSSDEGGSTTGAYDAATGKINLNRASKEELMTLPGIGEAKASAIIKYRDEVGWIASTDEIMNISGIKDRIYARISDLIEV